MRCRSTAAVHASDGRKVDCRAQGAAGRTRVHPPDQGTHRECHTRQPAQDWRGLNRGGVPAASPGEVPGFVLGISGGWSRAIPDSCPGREGMVAGISTISFPRKARAGAIIANSPRTCQEQGFPVLTTPPVSQLRDSLTRLAPIRGQPPGPILHHGNAMRPRPRAGPRVRDLRGRWRE